MEFHDNPNLQVQGRRDIQRTLLQLLTSPQYIILKVPGRPGGNQAQHMSHLVEAGGY